MAAVSPSALAAMARNYGWEKTEAYRDIADVYVRSAGPEIIIPRTDKFLDYTSVVQRIMDIFSRNTDQPLISIFKSLIDAEHDVIRFRARGHDDDGTISLQRGLNLISQAREVLLAAACSTVNPQAVYRAGANKDANEYLERVRLGQTEVGSFIAPILAPVPPSLQMNLSEDWPEMRDDPFERQVTRRLATGLRAIQVGIGEAVSGNAMEFFESSVGVGVSANLCEAIANIIDKTDEIDLSINWATTRPTPEKFSCYSFTENDSAILREAARKFKEKRPKPNQTLIASVKRLSRDTGSKDGIVTFKADFEGKSQSVVAQLSQEQYHTAISAHRDKKPVAVTGDLERTGQRWQLGNPEIRILEIGLWEDDDDESVEEV
ncbi:hypothetical protein [Jannaschia pohangensis]|uniref:hypothetical protein n=1 Tax=Jannaschia pohangensis TaxID=390807 RepID=UPI00111438A5|nr:hypothetical protein [Jannaschia pohangensis]